MIVTRTSLRTYSTIHAGCSTQVGRIHDTLKHNFIIYVYLHKIPHNFSLERFSPIHALR